MQNKQTNTYKIFEWLQIARTTKCSCGKMFQKTKNKKHMEREGVGKLKVYPNWQKYILL